MSTVLPFVVIGLVTGAVYGLAGMGLVLTYVTSGILNLGYGAVAALAVFVFYWLHSDLGAPWPLAAAVCLAVVAPVLGLLLELLARKIAPASDTVKVVATIGIVLLVEGIAGLWYPANPPTFPQFLSQTTVRVLGVDVTVEQFVLLGLSVAAMIALAWFFRRARLGVVMRAVVDSPELVAWSGDDPVHVRRWAWVLGTVFAAAAGLMLAPALPLDGVTLTTAVFAAFGAAAIGGFRSIPLTFVGGVAVGIAGAFIDKYSATVSWVGGIAPSLPFIVLFLVLVVIPRRRLAVGRLASGRRPPTTGYRAPRRVQMLVGAAVAAVLVAVPVFQGTHITLWTTALIDMVLLLSLGVLVRRSGQISLCAMAFAAIGAGTFGHFTAAHVPWLLALVLATLVAVPVGAVLAIPAVRVSGVLLAVATLGFGILAQQVFYDRVFLFGSSALGLADPGPDVTVAGLNLASGRGFYYLVLLITAVVVVMVASIGSGRLGRVLDALAGSPLALETQGTSATTVKVIVFCISAALASLSGALTGVLYHYSVGSYFPPFDSLTLVVLVVIITVGEPWYAIVGAIAYAVLPGYLTGATTTNVLTLLFGVGAVTVALGSPIRTVPASVRRLLDAVGGRRWSVGSTLEPEAPALGAGGAGSAAFEQDPGLLPDRRPVPVVDVVVSDGEGHEAAGGLDRHGGPVEPGLQACGITVRYGGVRAVDGVDLRVPLGSITGLVGPNGAGKTTTFNAVCGLVRPSSGRVVLHGVDVSRSHPARRARLGLGRTFQRTELLDALSVRDNVALGAEAPLAGRHVLAAVHGSRRSYRTVRAAADRAMELTGVGAWADMPAGLLTIGQRRLVELARVLAGPFDVLLLDEPSSGLDGHETAAFGTVLRAVVAEGRRGVLLVEHDMTLVRSVCDQVVVLDFGSVIFEGSVEEMLVAERVKAAYLGEPEGVVEGLATP